MEKQNKPHQITVKAGSKMAFCMCGLTKNGVYCDGSHKESDKSPKLMSFDKDSTIYICACQQSGNKPMCDGSHKSL